MVSMLGRAARLRQLSHVCWASLALVFPAAAATTVNAAASPKQLVETIDLSSLAISPDGRSVAFRQEQASVEQNRYETGWYVQPLDGRRAPMRVADGGDPLRGLFGPPLDEPPQWSPDDRWIYYRALIDGGVQVWRAATDGSRSEPVTQDAADVESFSLAEDGGRLLYTVGASRETIERAEQTEADRGIRIDQTSPLGEELFRSGLINGRLADERYTGNWVSLGGLLQSRPKQQWVLDVVSGALRVANDEDRRTFADRLPITGLRASTGGYDLRTRSDRGGSIAFIRRTGVDTHLQVVRSAESDAPIRCPDTVCNHGAIVGLAWRPGHDEVVFAAKNPATGGQVLYDWAVDKGAVRRIASDPGLIGGGRGLSPGEFCSLSADMAACVVSSADVPPHLERIDLKSGSRQSLYAPNQTLSAVRGPRVQALRWTDAKGHVFTGQYFPPVMANAGPAPLFITYYSCTGYLRGGLGDEWPLASLAGAGIAALCVQKPPANLSRPADNIESYVTALTGVQAAIDLLSRRHLIDPTRVGMGGLSFGSDVVMWVMMHSNLLAAASVTSSSVTPTYYRLHQLMGAPFTDGLRQGWGLGAPDETPEAWRRLSPAYNVPSLQAPLLMQMPEQEYLDALDYFAPLAASATPVELYVFPHEPHLKIEPRHLVAVSDRNLDWFRFWLQDYVDPDPAKADQYRRWSAMRVKALAAGQHPGQPDPASAALAAPAPEP